VAENISTDLLSVKIFPGEYCCLLTDDVCTVGGLMVVLWLKFGFWQLLR
jgi:hypothetical protein